MAAAATIVPIDLCAAAPPSTPASLFAALAEAAKVIFLCASLVTRSSPGRRCQTAETPVDRDAYGTGASLNAFEAQIAKLTGKENGRLTRAGSGG